MCIRDSCQPWPPANHQLSAPAKANTNAIKDSDLARLKYRCRFIFAISARRSGVISPNDAPQWGHTFAKDEMRF